MENTQNLKKIPKTNSLVSDGWHYYNSGASSLCHARCALGAHWLCGSRSPCTTKALHLAGVGQGHPPLGDAGYFCKDY